MYSSGALKKNKLFSNYYPLTTKYLARPKLGNMRSKSSRNATLNQMGSNQDTRFKKSRNRKSNSLQSKMEVKKRIPDHTDMAYNEAVARLRMLLNDSYTVRGSSHGRGMEDSGDETDDRSAFSSHSRLSKYHYHPSPKVTKKYPYYMDPIGHKPTTFNTQLNMISSEVPQRTRETVMPKLEGREPPPEVMSFIEKQEDYIDQLERESQYCRNELASLLGKVKEVISENEHLHEKQKAGLFKSVLDNLETDTDNENYLKGEATPAIKRPLEGPSIVFESRISELEAQLTQSKIDLKKAQEANNYLERQLTDASLNDNANSKKQIDILQRDKDNLQETISKLQMAAALNRDSTHEEKGAVEQARWEKGRAEAEARRLQSDLQRLRDNAAEQARRAADERDALERRYSQQVEQLSSDLAVHWDTASKLQLELEKQKRELLDLRREIAQKNAYIDEMKKDLQSRTVTMQSEQSQSSAEKCSLEQELVNARLAADRTERSNKQECARLNAEIGSLRQRLDRSDAETLHMRRENLRLAEQLAAAEKELNINKIIKEDRDERNVAKAPTAVIALPPVSPRPPDSEREKEFSSMIMDMEAKHVATVAELEGMIQSQNALMEKLTGECHSLTKRLEESSIRHKKEMAELHSSIKHLSSKLDDTKTGMEQISSSKAEYTPNSALHTYPQSKAPKDHDTNNDIQANKVPIDDRQIDATNPDPPNNTAVQQLISTQNNQQLYNDELDIKPSDIANPETTPLEEQALGDYDNPQASEMEDPNEPYIDPQSYQDYPQNVEQQETVEEPLEQNYVNPDQQPQEYAEYYGDEQTERAPENQNYMEENYTGNEEYNQYTSEDTQNPTDQQYPEEQENYDQQYPNEQYTDPNQTYTEPYTPMEN